MLGRQRPVEDVEVATTKLAETPFRVPPEVLALAEEGGVQVFRGEWDAEGVYFYQAYRAEIADWALEHGRFGGPWNPTRMTWIKPSFAWMLYRAGYGRKPGQERILRIKLSHMTVAELLQRCSLCFHVPGAGSAVGKRSSKKSDQTSKDPEASAASTGEDSEEDEVALQESCDNAVAPSGQQRRRRGGSGRVQWDPERDLFCGDGKKNSLEPRAMLRTRAIQIGVSGSVSEVYAENALSIEDVTGLAHAVHAAHSQKKPADVKLKMAALAEHLPSERPYMPQCPRADLVRLGLLPGDAAVALAGLGRGKAK
eukprot:TRINITY_DN110694_c0_g1_i1.p1 TRINITY_DN110694_c0_g1~~TRINITY_DN110694_c0_g1_i1.p1  ORF type:complete len:311 (-),score=26.58 TRINITY_DN110694_c0_g1_i1:487-1419(-)